MPCARKRAAPDAPALPRLAAERARSPGSGRAPLPERKLLAYAASSENADERPRFEPLQPATVLLERATRFNDEAAVQ